MKKKKASIDFNLEEFEDFEYKISKNNISDAVIELFGDFFVDEEEELYAFAHNINARISKNEKLKKNAIVNRNIVRLFSEASSTIENEDAFFEFVKACFKQRRKTIYNNLGDYFQDKEKARLLLEKASIDAKRRAETLTLEEFIHLYEVSQNDWKSICEN